MTEDEYLILGREILAAYGGGGTIHTRTRARLILLGLSNGPERDALATACRAAIATGDWKAVDGMVWKNHWSNKRGHQS